MQYPQCLEDLDAGVQFRVNLGDCLIFSAQHLHGTSKHSSGRNRFSLDFRICYDSDVKQGRGPSNVDNQSVGTTKIDFINHGQF